MLLAPRSIVRLNITFSRGHYKAEICFLAFRRGPLKSRTYPKVCYRTYQNWRQNFVGITPCHRMFHRAPNALPPMAGRKRSSNRCIVGNLGRIYLPLPLIIYSPIRPAKTFLTKGTIASVNDMQYITIKDVSPLRIITSRSLYL
jgi:hypothetical protein